MKLTELNEVLGEEITRVRTIDALSKDDLHRVDSIAKLSKQVIGVANAVWRTDKLKHETKDDVELEVSKLI